MRDLDRVLDDAVTEAAKKSSSYRGVPRVDVGSPGRYGRQSNRYTPIFNKGVSGSFEEEALWIGPLPTTVLRFIAEYSVAIGKVRKF
ncbi:hypothetical protein ANO14919_144030 [Xylariales sp. No.14919]|nr:hypothetical protein ANO14919_144030 [Xylariales sp. No.14919]